MADWFIKDEMGSTTGPYNEAQVRHGLATQTINDAMSVRQGGSEWIPAARVRALFGKLSQDGFFIRDRGGQVFGPFTRRRVGEMDQKKQLPNHYWIKQGKQSEWTEIRTTLKASPVAAKAMAEPRAQSSETDGAVTQTTESVPFAKPVIPAAPVMKLRGNSLADRLVTITERVEDVLFGSPLPNG